MSGERVSWASSAAARATMRANRGRDTGPELRIRRALHALGYRYRVDHPLVIDRRRRGDIVFTRRQIAIFIDGCYWHGCTEHHVAPRANGAFWRAKISANRQRDRDTDARLRAAGWTVVRHWEHEETEEVVANLVRRLGTPRCARG